MNQILQFVCQYQSANVTLSCVNQILQFACQYRKCERYGWKFQKDTRKATSEIILVERDTTVWCACGLVAEHILAFRLQVFSF